MSTARYAYEHVSSEILSEDMQFREGAPKPGERLPELDLPTSDGGQLKTSDLAGRPVLLVTSARPFVVCGSRGGSTRFTLPKSPLRRSQWPSWTGCRATRRSCSRC